MGIRNDQVDHPGKRDKQGNHHCNDLGNERERHFLDLCYGLEYAYYETNNKADDKHRRGYQKRHLYRFICKSHNKIYRHSVSSFIVMQSS